MPKRVSSLSTRGAMDHNDDSKRAEYLPDTAKGLRTEDLCDVVAYLMSKEGSEFLYDEVLDVFRFEDGRCAFCEEFADWKLLEERGYLDF